MFNVQADYLSTHLHWRKLHIQIAVTGERCSVRDKVHRTISSIHRNQRKHKEDKKKLMVEYQVDHGRFALGFGLGTKIKPHGFRLEKEIVFFLLRMPSNQPHVL